MSQKRIHYYGAGQMAEAMIRASIKNGYTSADNISCTDLFAERVTLLAKEYGVVAANHQRDDIASADYIVLGVRPQDNIAEIAAEIKPIIKADATVISIIAGVTMAQLTEWFGSDRAIVRIIPNTLTDTGFGYSGAVYNALVEAQGVDEFICSFGKVMHVQESQLDIFTGYGVAGPNYVYYFIEALVDAGVLAGLPRTMAKEIAYENLVGGVEMIKMSGLHPRQLMDINNSPAGVGMNGLFELNQSDFAAGLQKSVLAAVRRTTELGKK